MRTVFSTNVQGARDPILYYKNNIVRNPKEFLVNLSIKDINKPQNNNTQRSTWV